MPELARTIAARLREFIGNRRRAKHFRVRLPLRVSLIDQQPNLNGSRRSRSIDGYTLDISTTGLGLVVPVIRIGEHYLVGENRLLRIELELPGGPVVAQAVSVRYERLEEEGTENGYLIGVSIAEMNQPDRDHYVEYVTRLLNK
jgi:c-di-GMP-binding flagellar brake protein YcgR